jgi:hypothetical protein
MKKMQHKTGVYTTVVMAFLTLSILIAILPVANGAGSIILTPTTQTQGSSVTVAGTGFAASKAVAIVMGIEITVTNENHPIASPTGTGPFTQIVNHGPIKPGSFSFHCVVTSDTSVVESDYTDNGDGTLTSSSTYALNPFVNYITGAFGRSTTSAWDGYTVVFTASYTYYQYSVTPAVGVATSAAGDFSAPVTVPATASNGNLAVTAFDANGGKGTATLTVNDVIPEGFSLGIVIVLSVTAVIFSIRCIRKQPKNSILAPSKTI